ncbi:hypothetical protein L914_19373 [Phytophthora nicotianae]|uniref:Uncharacterized protein n=1 Tax=Phytophthora nicotianae TaxID=4792 RepID=W2MCM3_PHYNI|nr:hypothetical protein L914_19373 [Phytophthora nicotianae]
MRASHTTCIPSSRDSRHKRRKKGTNTTVESIVADEPDTTTIINEEDAELTEDDQAQMEALRGTAVDEMDTCLNQVLARLDMDEMATMRGIVHKFRLVAVCFRRSPKDRSCFENIQQKATCILLLQTFRLLKSTVRRAGIAAGIFCNDLLN